MNGLNCCDVPVVAVAMPLGSGCSAAEQLTRHAELGGLQVQVYPMKREAFERRFPKDRARGRLGSEECPYDLAPMARGAAIGREVARVEARAYRRAMSQSDFQGYSDRFTRALQKAHELHREQV